MSIKKEAERIAAKGRYGDSEIVHVAPWEVEALKRLSPTGDLTINPHTGKPEAFIFSLLLPMLMPELLAGTGIAATLGATGLAAASGALGGAADGLMSGDDPWESAAMGAALGGLGGGLFGGGAGGAAAGAQGTHGLLNKGLVSQGGNALKGMAPAAAESGGIMGFLGDNPMLMGLLPMMMGGMGGSDGTEDPEEKKDLPRQLPVNGGLAAAYRPANTDRYAQTQSPNYAEASMFPGYKRYAEGGPVAPMGNGQPQGIMPEAPAIGTPAQDGGQGDKQLVRDAMLALAGKSNAPQEALQRFVERFGPEALADLQKRIAALGIQPMQSGEASRPIQGPGDGMSDSIPASIDGEAPAALSTDEHVIPADVVSGIGNGSSGAGHKVLADMANRVRMARGGSVQQPKAIKAERMMPA